MPLWPCHAGRGRGILAAQVALPGRCPRRRPGGRGPKQTGRMPIWIESEAWNRKPDSSGDGG